MAEPTGLEIIVQGAADLFSMLDEDNREFVDQLPIAEAIQLLIENLDNTDAAFDLLHAWVDEKWAPLIQEQSVLAQKQAVETAATW